MKKIIFTLISMLTLSEAYTQCDPEVPLYIIDLSANPDTTWVLFEEDALDRNGQCCSASESENCIQFQITLNPNSAGVFFDYDGAGAFGSLNWQIDCGPQYDLRDTICFSDGGTHILTFCKPGSDNGNYFLVSVPRPTFPEDQFVPLNCQRPVEALGVTDNSVSWESISPGAPGQYDYLLSCTDCVDPVYSPDPSGPSEIEFRVCGYPILDYCVGAFNFCDTVKFTNIDSILMSVSPLNPTFCSGGDVTLVASASGGDGNFTYYWYDGALNLIGTDDSLVVSAAGSYTCEVREGNYDPIYCDHFNQTVAVVETLPPAVNAGPDQILCANDPIATLAGSIQYASGGIWSGGSGVFTPSNTDLNATYEPTNAEIVAGSVVLTLTSTGAGSSCVDDFDLVELFFIDTIQTDLIDYNLSCSDATIAFNPVVSGGLAPYTYSWSNGVTTLNNSLGNGVYCLTITDANGCVSTECTNISAPSAMDLVMSSTPATTDGGSDGTATATPSGGTAPYTYLWSNLGTNQTETGLMYGIYTVVVTDDNGCTHDGSVVVNEPRCNGFSISSSASDVLCNSDSTGSASVSTIGGLAPFDILWNDYANQTTSTANNLPAGVYEVIVTDDNGCSQVTTATVLEPDALFNSMSHTDATTQGGSDGTATSSPSGGFGAYYYAWSTLENTSSIAGLSTGWYYLTVSDDNACSIDDSVFINQPPCNEMNIFISTVSPLCNGDLNGEATLSVVNGVGPYSINWSTGQTDVLNINGLGAGFFNVELTDSRGCYTSKNYGVSEPSILSIGLAETPSTCFGSNNGTIDLSIAGGTYPYYSVLWSNSSTSEDLINLLPGAYSVTVTDQNGCSANDATSITEPTALSYTYSVQHVTCYKGTDGAIDLIPAGGMIPYTFDWSNGATTEDLSGIDVGGYIVTISDANFCELNDPTAIIVTEPTQVVATSITINCPVPGATQTQVDIVPGGGNGNYAISTDGGSTYGAYGDYSVMLNVGQGFDIMIKDINNCTSVLNHIDIDPLVVITDVSFNECYVVGQTNEDITVTVTGGTADYLISTDNGSTFNGSGIYTLSVPINDNYQLVAQDNLGCLSEAFSISLPAIFSVSATVTSDYNGQDVSCFGYSNGALTAVCSGGTPNYSYAWDTNPTSGGISISQSPSGLSAGTYVVEATDDNGCITTDTITINQPTDLTASSSVLSDYNGQDISCNGASDASINAIPGGGTPSYSYSWDTNPSTGEFSTSQNSTGLTAGNYIVTITDLNGCTETSSITVNEPALLTLSSAVTSDYNGQDISCNGEADASLTATPGGGTPGYTYSWDTNPSTGEFSTAQNPSGIAAGNYTVTVTDLNGCSESSNVTVNEPAVLSVSAAVSSDYNGQDISCFGSSDGSLNASPVGGTPGYSYVWDTNPTTGTIANTQAVNGLPAGDYMVTINDLNGCSAIAYVSLTEPTELAVTTNVTSDYNGQNVSCNGVSDASLGSNPSGGTPGYSYSWDTNPSTGVFSTAQNPSGVGAGDYILTITDLNGCIEISNVTVYEPAILSSSASVSSDFNGEDISCFGAADGSAMVVANGGTPGYSYSWDTNPSTGQLAAISSLNGIGAGDYMVTVTDLNGCVSISLVTLTQPDDLALTNAVTSDYNGQDISCNGASDGSLTASPSGGTPAYSYSWDTNPSIGVFSTSQNPSGLAAGNYIVVVTDLNGCSESSTVVITEPSALTLSAAVTSDYNGQDITCNGVSDGALNSVPGGGTPGYSFDWDTNPSTGTIAVTQAVSGLSAGDYTITLTDLNGCSISTDVTLNEPPVLSISVGITADYNGENISCNGMSDGELTVYPTGGTGAYDINWSNGIATLVNSDIPAGNYSVTVTDVNGCSANDAETLTEPTVLTTVTNILSDYNGEDISCYAMSDGSANIVPSGGVMPYTYLWDDGQNSSVANGLSAGTYTVNVSDANGCIDVNSVTLTQPDTLGVSAVITDVSCNGGTDGIIDVTPSGGTLPYDFNWDNGATTEDLIGITEGNFALTLSDANNCIYVYSDLIVDPTSLDLSLITLNARCFNSADGELDLTVTGGTAPYEYLWDNAGETTEDISELPAGTYNVVVTDAMGCYSDISGTISEPDSLMLISDLTNASCFNTATGSIDISLTGGTQPYSYNWSTSEDSEDISNLEDGVYSVVIVDYNGCEQFGQFVISEPDSLIVLLTSPLNSHDHNIDLNGGSDGVIESEVSGGTQPFVYEWSNGAATPSITGLTAGTYSVIVTDELGCKATRVIILSEPLELALPTAFSPNNDGDNDVYFIRGIEAYPSNTITVLNRWGNVVFEEKNYNNTWSGTNENGEALPDGVYFLLLEINSGEIKENTYVHIKTH